MKKFLCAVAACVLMCGLVACGSETGSAAPVSTLTVTSAGPTVTATAIETEKETLTETSEATVTETAVRTVPKTVVKTQIRTAVTTAVRTVEKTVQPNGAVAGALPNGDYLIGTEVAAGGVYKCNAPSDRLYWSVESRDGEIVDNDLGAIAQVRDGYTLKLSGCNADWTQVGASGPAEPVESAAPPPPAAGNADLGLSVPITAVPCDGDYVVFVGSAVTPGAYEADVQRFLTNNPGTMYLRTDLACSSLVQDRDGSPIYAVFHGPFPTRSSACSVSAQSEGSSVKQLIDSGEPMSDEQC